MVVYGFESRRRAPEHEHRAPQCFTESDEGDNDELQSVSTPLIPLSGNGPTASAEESFIDDGALGEGVDASFVDRSCGCSSQLTILLVPCQRRMFILTSWPTLIGNSMFFRVTPSNVQALFTVWRASCADVYI